MPYDGTTVIDQMVEGAIHAVLQEKGTGSVLLISDLQTKIEELSGLRYETAELVAAAERLARAKHLSFRDPKHLSFAFSIERYEVLNAKLRRHRERDERLRESWAQELRQRYDLTDGQLERLWHGLEELIVAALSTHAAEAAAFLYQGHDAEQIGFSAALSARYPAVDAFIAGDLMEIARVEYPRFFDTESADRRDFLADRIQASFVFHLLSIDPQASELVRSNVSEKTLYLDTNFLYRLLGIHGPALTHGPAITVLVSEQLNCRLVVAQETVDEFVRSLRSEVTRIRVNPIEREDYQRIAASQNANDWAFAQAYYREVTSGRVTSLDQFERKYSNVVELIRGWRIEIDEEALLTDSERATQEFQDIWSALNQWHRDMKGAATIDHDVFLLRYIRRLRGETDATLGRVRVWLLTYDRGLTAFAVHRASRDRFAPCILGDSWLQLTRPFLPRTDDYERAFVSMVQHPLLSRARDAVPFDHVTDALHRLERYSELPAQAVAAMVADAEFHRRLGAARDAEAERKVVELTVQRLATEAVKRAEHAEGKLTEALQRIETLEGSIAVLAQAKEAAELSSTTVRQTAHEQEAYLRARIDQVPAQIDAALQKVREENEQSHQALARRYSRNLRWIVYVSLVMMLTIAIAAALLLLDMTGSPVTLAVTGAWWAVIVLTLLAIPFWNRLGGVVAVVSLSIGIFGAIGLTYQLVTTPDSSETVPNVDRDGDEDKLPPEEQSGRGEATGVRAEGPDGVVLHP